MPLATTNTAGEIPYSITDCKVYPYTAGAPGAATDVPGIRRVEISAQIEEAEHRGDNSIMAVSASISSFDLTIEVGRMNLEAIAALAGGALTYTGTTPSQSRTLTRKSTDVIADYQIKAAAPSKSADGGTSVIVLPRCQWVGGPSYAMADNEFPVIEISARAIPDSSAVLYKFEQHESSTYSLPLS